MLYSEFLEGTGAQDNLYTYSEYERIQAIYNRHDTMNKADAYKLYIQPTGIIQTLLNELTERW